MRKTKTQIHRKARRNSSPDITPVMPENLQEQNTQLKKIHLQRAIGTKEDGETESPVIQGSTASRARIAKVLQRQYGHARMAQMMSSSPSPQSKIPIGKAVDQHEQEADKVAEQVTSGQVVAKISRLGDGPATPSNGEKSEEESVAQMTTVQRQANEKEKIQANHNNSTSGGLWAKRDELAEDKKPAINMWRNHSPSISRVSAPTIQRKAHKHPKANKDYKKFVAGRYKFPNFAIGLNGKFDVDYQPAAKNVDINVKVKFSFPDEAPPSIWERMLGIGAAARAARHKKYQKAFASRITNSWSRRYSFKNVRAPKVVWGKLNPTTVSVNVQEVKAGQHFNIQVRNKSKGRAQVHMGTMKLYKGDDSLQPKFNPATGVGEMKRVKRINPSPIQFRNNSSTVPGAIRPKLNFFATYLRRINNPKFNINIIGHSSTSGTKAYNKAMSIRRATAVERLLKGAGLVNHNVTTSGVGEMGATRHSKWRKVDIIAKLPAAWVNKQDTQTHEFGHMIGLGDEYGGAGAKSTHYNLVKKAFGNKYAQQVAKRGDTDYASIMEGGDDVRIQHYVTFWSALSQTTLTKAPVPTPKFGFKDWKFIG